MKLIYLNAVQQAEERRCRLQRLRSEANLSRLMGELGDELGVGVTKQLEAIVTVNLDILIKAQEARLKAMGVDLD